MDYPPLTMEDITALTKESLLLKETYERLYAIEDDLERSLMKQALEEKAKSLGRGLATKLKEIFKTCEANRRKMRRQSPARNEPQSTDFREVIGKDANGNPLYGPETPCDGFLIPDGWMVSRDGIDKIGDRSISAVCGRPVLPVAIWRNLEDKREKAVLKHLVLGRWKEVEVYRSDIATSSSLSKLADYGVDANSKNSTNLVAFFSDFINCNQYGIPVYFTTSKLGWKTRKTDDENEEPTREFVPYYKGVRFDAEANFSDLYGSIGHRGSYSTWLTLARSVRASKPMAPRVVLAASFASALIYPLGILGFFVDTYGATGGGKTVSLMLACSVWASPNENKFIGDFSATRTALETRLDMLYNLPLIIDDTSKKSGWIDYEYTVYDLTSGKGKTRSNLRFGNEREKTWKNVVICNGEHALTDQVSAIGARNRVIEVSCEDKLFESPWDVAETVKANYGFAGEQFVNAAKELDWQKLREKFLAIQNELINHKISSKQASSGACLLLADEIATEHIFQDGNALSFGEVEKLLLKENEISEGAECYQYLLDVVETNPQRFNESEYTEAWGSLYVYKTEEGRYCSWYITAYAKKLEEGGYSRKQFANWCRGRGILVTDKNTRDTKTLKIGGKSQKMVVMKMDHSIIEQFYGDGEDDTIQDEPTMDDLEPITLGELEKLDGDSPFDEPTFD